MSGRFGEACSSVCHCEDNVTCHHITGVCPSGCAATWAGTNCSVAHIASGKKADFFKHVTVTYIIMYTAIWL